MTTVCHIAIQYNSPHFLIPAKSIPSRKKHHGGQAINLGGEVRVDDDNEPAPENIHEEKMEECQSSKHIHVAISCQLEELPTIIFFKKEKLIMVS